MGFPIKNYAFGVILFNIFTFGLVPYIAQESKVPGSETQTAIEGLRAIKWFLSAPTCQINNFCLTVDKDMSVGDFVASKQVGNSIEKYTEIVTNQRSITVSGEVAVSHKLGESVFVYKERLGKMNQLCIGDFDCYSIPTDKNLKL